MPAIVCCDNEECRRQVALDEGVRANGNRWLCKACYHAEQANARLTVYVESQSRFVCQPPLMVPLAMIYGPLGEVWLAEPQVFDADCGSTLNQP
jgi:hypothetical protein